MHSQSHVKTGVWAGRAKSRLDQITDVAKHALTPATFYLRQRSQELDASADVSNPNGQNSSYDYAAEEREFLASRTKAKQYLCLTPEPDVDQPPFVSPRLHSKHDITAQSPSFFSAAEPCARSYLKSVTSYHVTSIKIAQALILITSLEPWRYSSRTGVLMQGDKSYHLNEPCIT